MNMTKVSSRMFETSKERRSAYSHCDCNTRACHSSLGVSVSKSWNHQITVGASAEFGILGMVKSTLKLEYGHNWGESLTHSSEFTCGGEPGFRSWVSASELWRETVYEASFNHEKCGPSGTSFTVKALTPVPDVKGQLKLDNLFCETERYKEC